MTAQVNPLREFPELQTDQHSSYFMTQNVRRKGNTVLNKLTHNFALKLGSCCSQHFLLHVARLTSPLILSIEASH